MNDQSDKEHSESETPGKPSRNIDGGPHGDSQRFFRQMLSLIMRPQEAWESIAGERKKRRGDFSKYYLPAVLLWFCGSVSIPLVFGLPLPKESPVTGEVSLEWIPPDVSLLFGQQAIFLVLYLFLPFLLAKPMTLLAKLFPRVEEQNGQKIGTISDARRLTLYSFAPVLTSWSIQAIPVLSIISLIVTIQGVFIFLRGIEPMMGVAKGSRVLFALACLVALLFCFLLVIFFSHDVIGNPYEQALSELLEAP